MKQRSNRQQRAVELVRKEMQTLDTLKHANQTISLNSVAEIKQAVLGASSVSTKSTTAQSAGKARLESANIGSTQTVLLNASAQTAQIKLPKRLKSHADVLTTTHRRTETNWKATSAFQSLPTFLLQPEESGTLRHTTTRHMTTGHVMSRKPERRGFVGFVGGIQAQNQAQQTFIETKSGLRMNRRAIDAANAERALRDSDARLRDAVRRLDAEKAHSEELARITASRRQKTAVTLRKRKEQSANSLKNNKQTQKDDGNAANSAGGIWIDGTATGLNDECVSLDFNLDELLVSAASPPRQQPQTLPSKFLSSPRGMAALYKTSHSPSLETHCAYENKENSGDGILEFYAFSSANSNTNIIPVVEKPSNWKLEIDEMVTLLDISSHYVDSRLSKKTHLLSDTTTTENIVEADDGAASLKDYNSSSHDAIVIEHKSPLMITAETHDVEIQTAISQPRRITLPNTVLTSIRNGKQKYCRARIIKSSGHSIHESIDAAEIIATEFFDNLLHTVATELDELGYEFIQNLIAAEFVDELNKED